MSTKRNMSPNSLANLRPPWKPGQSGNPKGRQPKSGFRQAVEELLGEKASDAHGQPLEITNEELLAKRFVDRLLAGEDLKWVEPFLARVWPAPKAAAHQLDARPSEIVFGWRIDDAAKEIDEGGEARPDLDRIGS